MACIMFQVCIYTRSYVIVNLHTTHKGTHDTHVYRLNHFYNFYVFMYNIIHMYIDWLFLIINLLYAYIYMYNV